MDRSVGLLNIEIIGIKLTTNLVNNVLVLPAVSKVIFVSHTILRPPKNFVKPGLSLTHAVHAELAIRGSIKHTTGGELVQMAIAPSHDHLKSIMKMFQNDITRYQKSPPYGRIGTPQRDFELINGTPHRSNPHQCLLIDPRQTRWHDSSPESLWLCGLRVFHPEIFKFGISLFVFLFSGFSGSRRSNHHSANSRI